MLDTGRRLAGILTLALLMAACGGGGVTDGNGTGTGTGTGNGTEPSPTDGPTTAGGCISQGGGGQLTMPLSGALEADLDWGDEGTVCGGLGDAANEGLTITFQRPLDEGGEELILLVTISGIAEGATASGLSAVWTVSGEAVADIGGVFTTPPEGCTMDVTGNENLVDEPVGSLYRVSASGSCTEPAAPIVGETPITIGEHAFVGIAAYSGG